MAKSKKVSRSLVRSDRNLLAFGLFGAALLIGVFLYFDYRPLAIITQSQPMQSERTYRVETAPAAITTEEQSAAQENVTPEEDMDAGEDY